MPSKLVDSIDTGSNYQFGDKMLGASAPRSLFDFGHLVSTTVPNAGYVFPVDWQETLPGDDWDIVVNHLLRVMPQVVPLYSRQRVYVYAFWSRLSDLWPGFQTFMKKGYSGNVIKTIPKISADNVVTLDATVHANSLADCLGLPIGASGEKLASSNVSALPLMMLLRIWRDYFCNKNFYINDRVILPDDDSRFRLDDDGQLLSAKDAGKTFKFKLFGSMTTENDLTISGNAYSFGIFFHDYPDDRFTSALPFAQRGDAPKIDGNQSLSGAATLTKTYAPWMVNPEQDTTKDRMFSLLTGDPQYGDYATDFSGKITGHIMPPLSSSAGLFINEDGLNGGFGSREQQLVNAEFAFRRALFNNYATNLADVGIDLSGVSVSGLALTLNQIRELAVAQTELEKMARTDGSYMQFGLTFFGEVSKAAQDFRPTYVGGTYANVVFTEVLQTSGSQIGTTTEDASPLGAYAGHGISGQQQGYIGRLHCDDYGILMTVACIMPDVYYSQGLDKKWTRSLQSDMYLPERARLGMIPVLNEELYFQNVENTDHPNKGLWAWQNPFDELRYCENKIHGKIADPDEKNFFPYTQSRKFTNLVNYGREFAEAKNVRKDYLYAPVEDAYTMQFSFDMRVTRALPYKPVPASII